MYCHKINHSVSNCFRKQREDEERKQTSYSRSKSPVQSINQHFKANTNQTNLNEQPSSFPVDYSSRNIYDSINRSSSRNTHSPSRFSCLISPSTSRRSIESFRFRFLLCDRELNSNRTPSRSKHTEFYNQRRNSRSTYCSSSREKCDCFFFGSDCRNRQYFRIFIFIISAINKTTFPICVCLWKICQ